MRILHDDQLNIDYTMFSDTVATAIVSTSGAVVSQDYPSGAEFAHFSADTRIFIHPSSTGVLIPSTSISASTASTNWTIIHGAGHEHIYRRPSGSTGYSITAESSAMVTIEFWKG